MQRAAGSLLVYLCALAIAALAPAVHAQTTTPTDTQVNIITPLSLVNTDDLDFGRIIAGPTAGTVTVSPSNVVSNTGGATAVGGTQPARFYGFGQFNRIVSLNLASNTITLTRAGGGASMVVSNFTVGSSPPTTLSTTPRYFRIAAPNGFFSFTVGGRLNVGANQLPGVYDGQFTVNIVYF